MTSKNRKEEDRIIQGILKETRGFLNYIKFEFQDDMKNEAMKRLEHIDSSLSFVICILNLKSITEGQRKSSGRRSA